MAHNPSNLSVLAYANGWTLWHYTTDELGVDCDGYFDGAAGLFRDGDVIEFSMPKLETHYRVLITSTENGKVTAKFI